MAATFSHIPSYATALNWKPSLLDMAYGDGYEQSMPDGINNKRQRWAIGFKQISSAEAATISGELMATGGSLVVFWTPPAPYNATPLLFKVKEFNHTYDQANTETITFEFLQVFNQG